MTDLVSPLLEAIGETERLALAASPAPWRANAEHDEVDAEDDITVCYGFALSGPQLRATVDHIVLHDPSSVLRRCAGDRELVGMCRAAVNQFERKAWENDEQRAQIVGAYTMAFMALTHLAEGYGLSDHQEGDNG